MPERDQRPLAVALVAGGSCLTALSMAADELGLGSLNGTFGTGQFIGVTAGLVALFVGGFLWSAGPRSRLAKRALIASAVAAAAVWVAFVVIADPVVCPDCLHPNRPKNSSCGPDWNPTTSPGGFSSLACDLTVPRPWPSD